MNKTTGISINDIEIYDSEIIRLFERIILEKVHGIMGHGVA